MFSPGLSDGSIRNLLTFDIEDYYHIFYRNYLGRAVDPSGEVVMCTDLILEILDEFRTKATFFVVGKVAELFPQLVRRIHDAGHEVSSHGYGHVYVNRISQGAFRDDLSRSVEVLLGITGVRPMGFRAPQFSIDHTTPWALDILAEMEFRYDSSLSPGINPRGNNGRLRPHDIVTSSGIILEIPLSGVSIGGRFLPAAGGGFLRLFPRRYNKWAIDGINRKGHGAVVYMHPYEFEEKGQPISYANSGIRRRVRAWAMHRGQLQNRYRSIGNLRWLLENYRFTSIADAFQLQT